jgi:glycosyltransferase involved in cell wall biosynthesis
LKISIITINYNNLSGLKKTVESVINQTHNHIEYIVIDGGSTDGSAVYIKENAKYFTYWVSEPDKGIYNAMNKGIDRATGEYLLFLNSGDYLVDNRVVAEFASLNSSKKIVYGNAIFEGLEGRRLEKMPSTLSIGVVLTHVLNHQSMFHHKSLFSSSKRFSYDYEISSDWVFYNNALIESNFDYLFFNRVISVFDTTGISTGNKNLAKRVSERIRYIKSEQSENIDLLVEDYGALLSQYKIVSSRYKKLDAVFHIEFFRNLLGKVWSGNKK